MFASSFAFGMLWFLLSLALALHRSPHRTAR